MLKTNKEKVVEGVLEQLLEEVSSPFSALTKYGKQVKSSLPLTTLTDFILVSTSTFWPSTSTVDCLTISDILSTKKDKV